MKKIKLNIQRFANGEISLGSNGALSGRIIWWSTAGSSSENSSNVSAELQIRRNDGYTTTGTFTGNLQIHTENQNYSWYGSIGSGWTTVKGFNVIVGHNQDGYGQCYIGGSSTGPSGTSLAGKTVSGGQIAVLDRIARYFTRTPSISLQTQGTTSCTFRWETSETCNWIRYHLDGSSGWIDVFSGSATSGTFTVSNLNSNTTHTVYVDARRQDSGLWSVSNTVNFKTSDKTVRIRINGQLKQATPYVRVNGTWKVSVPNTRVNNTWKRGK